MRVNAGKGQCVRVCMCEQEQMTFLSTERGTVRGCRECTAREFCQCVVPGSVSTQQLSGSRFFSSLKPLMNTQKYT